MAGVLLLAYAIGRLGRSTDTIERRAMIAVGLYLGIFALEFARSMANPQLFNALLPDQFQDDLLRYTLSFFVKPALFVVLFIFILKTMVNETNRVITAISVAIFLLSAAIIVGILQDPSVLSRGRHAMADLCLSLLGMHYNPVGTIYITVGPLLVYLAASRGVAAKLNLGLAVAVLLVLQSRSALLAFAITAVLTLIVLRRTLLLMVIATVGAVACAFWHGPTTAALLSVGIDDGSVQSVDALLSGRLDTIWIPLVSEWFRDPTLLIFGAGRYGILTSPLWRAGDIFQATHAHNAFIDFFLDSGIVLTLVLIIGVIAWLVWSRRVGAAMRSPLYWALFMCPVAYLIGTLTERQFYPAVDNMFLFPILAVMLNVVRVWVANGGQIRSAASRRLATVRAPAYRGQFARRA